MLGIDLGYDTCCAAVFTGEGPRVLRDPENPDALTPAAVAVDLAGKVLAGHAAKKYLAANPDAGVPGFLGDFGRGKSYTFGGRAWTPAQCAEQVFAHLKNLANAEGSAAARTVVAVPAYFNDAQRMEAKEAAQKAGLQVRQLLNRPTAAALAHAFSHPRERRLMLVLEWQARNFDVTVLEMLAQRFEVLAADGALDLDEALLSDARRLGGAIDVPLRRALNSCSRKLDGFDEILLAGPQARVDALNVFLSERHGRKGQALENPGEAVARGAAIYARIADELAALPPAQKESPASGKSGCLLLVMLLAAGAAALLC